MSEPATASCLHDFLVSRAERTAEAAALLALGRAPMTYSRLLRQVEEVAGFLNAMGIGSGDRVATVVPDGPEMVVSFLAVASTAVCAPLNPGYRKAEFEFYLADLQPKALIVQTGLESPASVVAGTLGIPVIELSPLHDQEAGAFLLKGTPCRAVGSPVFGQTRDVALVLHTSGTTSRPNLVPLTHANLCCSALNIVQSLALTPADRCLNVMPLFHIHGLIGAALSSIAAGGSVVCTPGFNAPRFFEWMETFRPTWYTAVPTMHQAILARAAKTPARSSLRFIRSCSSALPPQVMARLENVFAVPVVEAYGMTEAAHQIACNPLPPRERKPGSVGVPTGTEVAIIDDSGNLVGSEEIGEIVISGENVTAGYLSNSGAKQSPFVGKWLRTGDQGLIDRDGYLFIKGRIKEIINRGGEKISPREIEDVLMDHPAVAQAVVFALPDARLGEDVAAAVTLREGASANARELRNFANGRLADFKLPNRIVFLPEIPKGPTGKIQRIGLAEKLQLVRPDAPASDEIPRVVRDPTAMQDLLSAIWHQLLQLDSIGLDDDFFELGGDSLSATQLGLIIEHVAGVQLTVGALFEVPTIRQLAILISEGQSDRQRPRIAAIQPLGSRPPFFCVGAGPLFRGLAERLGKDQPLIGLQFLETEALPTPYQLEDIAAFHVETIRTMQPEGPYFIGGWCVSGLVAYEVAQQLLAKGERVALLVLFDAVNPWMLNRFSRLGALRARSYNLLQKLRLHFGIMRQLGKREAATYVIGRLQTVLLNCKRTALRLAYGLHLRLDIRVDGSLRDAEEVQRLAARSYRPQPYDGRALLFQRTLRPRGRYQDAHFGWGELIRGGLEVHEIPGDHRDMFSEPQVEGTARELRACLRELQKEARKAMPKAAI
jgi:oxalate---CoA ligase